MKYALGNMLNGAGGLNADQLALDLQFAADKTLTARIGPTPVLTRGSTGTFVGSNGLIQSAGNNIARFDHDPVTLASRGLLIEEGRTNLVVQSQAPATSPWSDTSNNSGTGTAIATNNTVIAPDGTTTGATLSLSARSAVTRNQQISQTQTVAGVQYVSSMWVKATTTGDVGKVVNIWQGNGSTAINTFSVTLTNTWTRVSTTGSTIQIAGTRELMVIGRLSHGLGGPTDLTAVSLDIWGMQTEAGAFPTSYIPTTTSALARSADVCSITGANFTGMWNASEGTMYIEADPSRMPGALGSNRMMACATSGSYATQTLGFGKRSGILRTDIYLNNGQFNAANSQNPFKAAAAIKSGDNAGAYAGSIVATSTTSIGTADRLFFYDVTGAAGGHPTCTIAAFRYYKKRLPNAKLVSLTV